MHPSYSSVPNELLRPIVEHLRDDKASLCAISLTSSTLRQEGQRVLFRNVRYSVPDDWYHDGFMTAVIASPMRLALFVEAYTLERISNNMLPENWQETADAAKQEDEWLPNRPLEMISTGLTAMRNLKSLELRFIGSPSAISSPILHGCSFKLERFVWHVSHHDHDEDLITYFLPRQDGLKHLGIMFRDSTLLDHSKFLTLCPRLTSLTANWRAIQVLLPGHQIETLSWDGYIARGSTQVIPTELTRIKSLSYGGHTFRESLERFIDYLQDLEVLELVHPRKNDLSSLSLDRLPRLRIILIIRNCAYYLSTDVPQSIIDAVFLKCAKLEYIDVEHGSYDERSPITYKRHLRPREGCLGVVEIVEKPPKTVYISSEIM